MGALRSTWLNKLLALFLFCAAFAQAAETITYYVPDLAGNPIAALDEQGNLLWKESYRPYGDRLRRQAGEQNGLWFHGMPIDDETGLSYFGARWYDPAVGRFMGVDPQRFVEQNLQSFNRYAYGNNNPYRYVDPDGQLPLDVVVDAGFVIYDAGRMIGAGAAYAAGALSGNKALRGEGAAGLKEVGVDLGASVAGLAVPYLPVAVTRGGTTVAKGVATTAKESSEVIHVTKSGVALPPGTKHQIPQGYVQSPHRSGSYGEMVDGKFIERLRIDPATPPGQKGPNYSHYHLDGKGTHYSPRPGDKDPGFGP